MRIFLDAWDKQLTKNMESLFQNYLKKMVIGFAIKQDIKSIKRFKSIKKLNNLPYFLKEKIYTLAQGDYEEEHKQIKIKEYFVITESISALLEYRKDLIRLSEREESGIFDAYFKSQIKQILILAEKILVEKFNIMLKKTELKI